MTAISGVWSFGDSERALAGCREVSAQLSIYGPHDERTARSGSYAVSRNLYRTVAEDDFDRQPLIADDRWLIAADLRLDNRDDLSSQLGFRTDQLATVSDAEIFAQTWVRWRDGALEKLNGDYAVAVYDIADQTLTLARDPFGQRPLFYRHTDEVFVFASMPQPLAAFSGLRCAIDEWHLAEFISDLPLSGTRSFYDSVQRVEPGSRIQITKRRLDKTWFWSPKPIVETHRKQDFGEELRHELDQAVWRKARRRRGRLGSHLSSGWDSSAVTTSAAVQLRATGEQLHAFTAAPADDFTGKAIEGWMADESGLAASTAALHENIVHTIVRSRPIDLRDLLEWTHQLAGRPVGSVFNHHWWQSINNISAEHGVRVMLTAEAGNFTFSFGRLHETLADLFRHGPWNEFRAEVAALLRGGMSLGEVMNKSAGGLAPPRLYEALRGIFRAPKSSNRDFTFLHPDWAKRMQARHRRVGWDTRPSSDSRLRRLERLRMADSGTFRKLALARWAVDERDPTADIQFVNYCLSLPPRAFLEEGSARPAARAALAGRVSEAVLNQQVRGMQSADWHTLIEPAAVRNFLRQCRSSDSVIDYAGMEKAISDWPRSGCNEPQTLFRYQFNLFRALAGAHFARNACG